MPSLAEISERLSVSERDECLEGAVQRAAVAAILRELDGEPEILFIKRADKLGDPWSGQMAFPGGHVDASDASQRHAAERETLEEIGLDLSAQARLIGALEAERPVNRRNGQNMAVVPFVYELSSTPAQYALNHEVAEIHWAKIGPMLRHETLTSIDWVLEGKTYTLPGFDVSGRIVWGLTFRMLNRLFQAIDPNFVRID